MIRLLWEASALATRYVEAFFHRIRLMGRCNLNATNAAVLFLFHGYAQSVEAYNGGQFLRLAADERLIRAANAEGIRASSPEILPQANVPVYLESM